MKKIFAYFLAAALLLSATACGGKSEAAKSADEQIAAIGEVTLDSEPQISAAEEAVAALAEQDRQQLEHLDTLTDARAAYEALLLDAAAAEIEAAIAAIGTVTIGSSQAIGAAASAYDSAPAEVQALVENADVLDAAQKALSDLYVSHVEEQIDAIGTVTLDSEAAIAAARDVFNSLPTSLQEQVENAAALFAAEEALTALHINQVSDQIDAIGTVTLDSEAAIAAARAAFDALPASLREQVGNAAALSAAEEALVTLKRQQAELLLSNMYLDEDKVQNIQFYYPKAFKFYSDGKWAADRRCFVLPYIGRNEDSIWLRLVCNYTGGDWVFFEKIIYAVDDERYTDTFDYYDVVRDNGGSDVWEYVDTRAYELDVEMLWEIADSTETIVRFEGSDYYYDFTVSETDKQAIREVLTAYEALTAAK